MTYDDHQEHQKPHIARHTVCWIGGAQLPCAASDLPDIWCSWSHSIVCRGGLRAEILVPQGYAKGQTSRRRTLISLPERFRLPLLLSLVYIGSAIVSVLMIYGIYALFGILGIAMSILLLVIGYSWLINTAIDDIIDDMRGRTDD